MASERKIRANRTNAQKSRGPRSDAGKRRSSRNALRHGLTRISHKNSPYAKEIRDMAHAICEGDSDPLVFKQALIIAECEVLLHRVDEQSVQLVERLRHSVAAPISRGMNQLKASFFVRSKQNWRDVSRLEARVEEYNEKRSAANPSAAGIEPPDQSSWSFTFDNERQDEDAFLEALPDLQRFARYERRAWSRRKRALNELIAIKATRQSSTLNRRGA